MNIKNTYKYFTSWSVTTVIAFFAILSVIYIEINSINNESELMFVGLFLFVLTFFLFIISCVITLVFREIYSWNNGYSRKTGLPWIKISSYGGCEFIAGDNKNEKLSFEYYTGFIYCHEKALVLFKNHKLINNISSFD
jgi:hypothetical protein